MKLGQPHLGLIFSIVLRHWRRLPIQIRASIDVGDWIDEAMLCLLQAKDDYDPGRSSPATFVYLVVNSRCGILVNHYMCQKEFTTNWVPWEPDMDASRPDYLLEFRESRDMLQQVIREASPELRQALTCFLESRRYRRWPPALLQECRTLSCRHGLGYHDFLRVLEAI